MKQELETLFSQLQSDIRAVYSGSETMVGMEISFDNGEARMEFHEIDPPKMSMYTESYELDIRVSLEDSDYITDLKPELIEFTDKIHPDSNGAVTQDYPTASLRFYDEMSDEEVENLLSIGT